MTFTSLLPIVKLVIYVNFVFIFPKQQVCVTAHEFVTNAVFS